MRTYRLYLMLLNFTMVYTDTEMKKSIGGSSKMNRFNVSMPVSENIKEH